MAKIPLKNVVFLMQQRLSASASATQVAASPLPSSSFTVDYLVSSFGLPLKSAIAVSQRIHLKEEKTQRYASVLDLFTSHGFNHTHIATIMEKGPKILTELKVDENLKPKLEYLAQNGFSGSHLHELIVSNPSILWRSLSSRIKPSLEFLKSVLGTEESVLLAVKRSSWLLTNDLGSTLLPNIDLLVKEGVPFQDIPKFFLNYPNTMQSRVRRLVPALQVVRGQLGIDPSAPKFLVAVTRIASLGVSLWEKKVQLFNKSFGFSQEQVLTIFRRCPECFGCSEETLNTKLGFYLNTVKLKLDDIVSYPQLLSYAIDTRSRPRHNVLKLLLSNKLLKEDAKLAYLFTISEERFLKKCVMAHVPQVPSLLEMYSNDKLAKKIGI